MRTKKTIATLLSLMLLLTSCAPGAKSNSNEELPMKSIEDVPPYEEYKKYPIEKIKETRNRMESIPIEGLDTYYTHLIKEFLDADKEKRFELLRVEIEKDRLSLITGENLKPHLNLIFRVDLKKKTQRDIDDVEIAEKFFQQLREYLNTDTFFATKAAQISVSTYDLNGYLIKTLQCSWFDAHELKALEQPETEYAAQTVAFDFKKQKSEFLLKKFGAIQETKELYVEYFIADSYFGSSEETIKAGIDGLSSIRDEIKEYLLSKDAMVQYIKENGLEILTISFYNGILEDSYLTFNYPI